MPVSRLHKEPPRAPRAHRLLTVDPGTSDVGVAVLQDGLVMGAWWVEEHAAAARCPRCPVNCPHAQGPLQRSTMAGAVLDQAGELQRYDLVLVEWPQIYLHPGAPADDLLDLAGVAAAVCYAAHAAGVPAHQGAAHRALSVRPARRGRPWAVGPGPPDLAPRRDPTAYRNMVDPVARGARAERTGPLFRRASR